MTSLHPKEIPQLSSTSYQVFASEHLTSVCKSSWLNVSSLLSPSIAKSLAWSGCALIVLMDPMQTFRASRSSVAANQCWCTVGSHGSKFGQGNIVPVQILIHTLKNFLPLCITFKILGKQKFINGVLQTWTVVSHIGHENIWTGKSQSFKLDRKLECWNSDTHRGLPHINTHLTDLSLDYMFFFMTVS